jgi:hypothetical protein
MSSLKFAIQATIEHTIKDQSESMYIKLTSYNWWDAEDKRHFIADAMLSLWKHYWNNYYHLELDEL